MRIGFQIDIRLARSMTMGIPDTGRHHGRKGLVRLSTGMSIVKKLGTEQSTQASSFLSSHRHPNDLEFAQTKG